MLECCRQHPLSTRIYRHIHYMLCDITVPGVLAPETSHWYVRESNTVLLFVGLHTLASSSKTCHGLARLETL